MIRSPERFGEEWPVTRLNSDAGTIIVLECCTSQLSAKEIRG